MDTVKPARPEVLQVSDGNVNEKPLTTGDFVTKQAIEPYCREKDTTEGKLGFAYLYEGGVLIRQSKTDACVQTAVPASFRAPVLYMAHYLVLADLPGER